MGREMNGRKAGVDTWGDGWKDVLLSDGLAPIQKEIWMSGEQTKGWIDESKEGIMDGQMFEHEEMENPWYSRDQET